MNIHFKNVFLLQVKIALKLNRKEKKLSPTKISNISKHSSVKVYPSIRILDFFIYFPSMSVLKEDKY